MYEKKRGGVMYTHMQFIMPWHRTMKHNACGCFYLEIESLFWAWSLFEMVYMDAPRLNNVAAPKMP